MPSTLPRNSFVKYQLDDSGELFRAWVLSPEEAAKPDKYATPRLPWSTSPDEGRTVQQLLGQQAPSRIGLRPGEQPRDTSPQAVPGQSNNP
jgi:hypothetical protein